MADHIRNDQELKKASLVIKIDHNCHHMLFHEYFSNQWSRITRNGKTSKSC